MQSHKVCSRQSTRVWLQETFMIKSMPLVLCGMVAQWRGRRPSKSRWSAEAPFSNINSRRETAPTDAARCTAEEPSEVWGGGKGEGGIEGGREG